jgi:hypothetical protein
MKAKKGAAFGIKGPDSREMPGDLLMNKFKK